MWYEVPTVNLTEWLVSVVDLFGATLDAVLGFSALSFFASVLLCMTVLALFYVLTRRGRK